jgi:RNA polymerase subunit RPABC4/transcription elongation factor Spt4
MEVHDHMLNRSRVPADGLHLPLRKLALCLDCDECFELGQATCPACGSATWTTAARFLKLVSEPEVAHRGSSRKVHSRRAAEDLAIAKHLLIVARHRRELYEQIKRAFAGHETVQIVLDRRVSERRRRKEPGVPDRRGADRRAHAVIDDQLRTIGWSLVLLDLAKSKRS